MVRESEKLAAEELKRLAKEEAMKKAHLAQEETIAEGLKAREARESEKR